ncbi:MAG: outer membrane protein transport protein [Polyangiaceae bacterium]|nr:outer membrane protein transport protein [Polyangiaceae bacterium]
MNKGYAAAVALFVATFSEAALANTEPPPAYDARSVGMGSTGVAHVENATALYHNPAALDGVGRGAFTGAFSPLLPQMRAPLEGPDTEVKSTRSFGPMFFVGGAYRVHDRITLGLAAYPTMGFGATYEDLAAMGGLTMSVKLSVIELAPGVSVALTDWLALGAAYRISRFGYSAETPTPTPTGALVSAETELSDWNFLGFHVGALVRPTRTTRVGLAYRSKITADLEGDTSVGEQDLDTSMEFSVPHIIKLGVAQGLLEDRLLLALDLRYALFKDANESMVVETEGAETETALDWKDSVGAYFGAEFFAVPETLGIRAGYSLASSATPKETAMPIMPPPGLQHGIHLGVGVVLGGLGLDLGGYYMFGGADAEPDIQPPDSMNGNYHMDAILASLSATYRFGTRPGTAPEPAGGGT